MSKGFTILDHPADMGIEARGNSLAEAFERAAEALMSIILDLSSADIRESRSIEVAASDYEHLLVKWLTEILYLYDGEEFVGKTFRINELSQTALKATVQGEPLDANKHRTLLDVKAITYHQLSVFEKKEEAVVRVYLDI